MFEQGLEAGERGSHGDVWGKGLPSSGNSLCQGPEVSPGLVCWRIAGKSAMQEGNKR